MIYALLHLSLLILLLPADSHSEYTEDEQHTWITAVDKFQVISHPHKEYFIGILEDIVADANIKISSRCRTDLDEFSGGLKHGNVSQMLMFDSFSKPTGMMSSQGYNLGSHRQCLHQGRYVLLAVRFPLPDDASISKFEAGTEEEWISFWSRNMGFFRAFPFYAAICVPDHCREHDISRIFDSQLVHQIIDPIRIEVASTESYIDDPSIYFIQVLVYLILGAIAQTVVWSTIINFVMANSDIATTLQPFDLLRNFQTLVKPRDQQQQGMAAAFDLLRVMYILFAIFSSVLFGMSSVLSFRVQIFTASYNPIIRDFFKGLPVTAGFNFIIAASLSSFNWLNVMSSQKFNFAVFAGSRVLRLLPVMLFMVMAYMSMPWIPFLGPFGPLMQQDLSEKCYQNGWRELFFISNFYPVHEACNIVNSSVSIDLQLYIASFVILVILAKNQKIGMYVLLSAIAAGVIGSGYYSTSNSLHAYLNLDIDQVYNSLNTLHQVMYHTIHHVPAYGIGIMLGVILFKQQGKRRPIGLIGLLVSTLPVIAVTIFSAFAFDEEYRFIFGPTAEVIYTYAARMISSICTALMFYGLLNTDHPVVRYIMESRPILVISRLSYCMLASHALIVNLILASLESQITTSIFAVTMSVAVFAFGLLLALEIYLFIEAPFRNLLNSGMSGGKSKSQ